MNILSYTARSLLARRRRLVGALLAILIGTSLVSATLVMRDSVQTDLRAVFADANAGIDASVQGERTIGSQVAADQRPVPADLTEQIDALGEVGAAASQVTGMARILDAAGNALGAAGAPTTAESWIDDPDLNVWALTAGRAPAGPGEVAIDAATASSAGLSLGDETTVLVPSRVQVRIVGLVDLAGHPYPGGGTVTLFTPADAQRYFGAGPGLVSRILVSAAPGVSGEELTAALAALVPPDVVVVDRADLVDESLAAVDESSGEVIADILLAVALVAALVALLGIHNTFTVTTAQRTGELALLRALGASRRQLITSMLTEGVVVGVIGSLLGLVAGIGLVIAAGAVLAAAGQPLFGGMPRLDPGTLAIAFGIGVVGALVSMLGPAWRTSRVSPIEAFTSTQVEGRTSPGRIVLGGTLIVLGAAGITWSTLAGLENYVLVGLGALAVIVGAVAASPAAVRPVAAALTAPLRRLGASGGLARTNAERSPRRTAASASAMLVGLTLVAMLAVIGGSVRTSMERIVDETVHADFVTLSSGFSGSGLSPEIVTDLAQTPEVSTAVGVGLGAGRLGDVDSVFTVTDPDKLEQVMSVDVVSGAIADLGGDGIAVSTDRAADLGWQLGTQVPLTSLDGTTTMLTVRAIYRAHAADGLSTSIVPASVWRQQSGPWTYTSVFVNLADGVSTEAGRAAVEQAVAPFGAPTVLDRQAYLDSQLGGVRQLLGLLYALFALAVLIAAMGISNTLSLSIHERTREIGILRSIGQSRRQTKTMIAAEAMIISLLGTAVGLAAGVFIGWGVISTLADQIGIGTFDVPYLMLVTMIVVGTGIGVLAALRPAARAARIPPTVAMTAQ